MRMPTQETIVEAQNPIHFLTVHPRSEGPRLADCIVLLASCLRWNCAGVNKIAHRSWLDRPTWFVFTPGLARFPMLHPRTAVRQPRSMRSLSNVRAEDIERKRIAHGR